MQVQSTRFLTGKRGEKKKKKKQFTNIRGKTLHLLQENKGGRQTPRIQGGQINKIYSEPVQNRGEGDEQGSDFYLGNFLGGGGSW